MLDELIKNGDITGVRRVIADDPGKLSTSGNVSPILLSVYHGQSAITELLVRAAVQLSIHEAAAVGDVHQLEACLNTNPDLIDAFAADGFTPLGLAAFFGHEQAVHLLLERGATVNLASSNSLQVMPLHSAAANANESVVRLLLTHGAEVNAQQEGGFTPLMEAANSGHEWLVKLLLEHGADPSMKADDGRTAYDFAMKHSHLSHLLTRDGD